MKIKTIQGKKNEHGNDRVLLIQSEGKIKHHDSLWEKVKNEDVLRLVEHIFANEDVIYPKPKFLGSSMFFDEIIKIYAKRRLNVDNNDTLRRYESDN